MRTRKHDIYADDAVCAYPQSGERIVGRVNLQALRSHHPGKPSGFNVRRILGKGDLWITEYIITYRERPTFTVSIMEFRDGKVVHETQYFADLSKLRTGGANGSSGSHDASSAVSIVAKSRELRILERPGGRAVESWKRLATIARRGPIASTLLMRRCPPPARNSKVRTRSSSVKSGQVG